MFTDENAVIFLVLTVVFISVIALLGMCFLVKLGKIDDVEDNAGFTERR